jgi:predicted nucleic acid-binding protein
MIYIIDTSSIIELIKRYPEKIFKSLYKEIDKAINAGNLLAPEQVRKELERVDDDAKKWAISKNFYVNTEEEIFSIGGEISKMFLNILRNKQDVVADPYIIALAKIKNVNNNVKIITEENAKKCHLPDVAMKYCKINSIKLIGYFKEMEWEF